ncbi:MAG: universal stress protein [Halanaeroarchaeum sp.]
MPGEVSRYVTMFETIVVPTDGSENAERAIDHAAMLAAAYGATVHGVYVVNLTYAGDFESGADGGVVLESLEREGEKAVDAVRSRCEAAGVDFETTQLEGRPATRITEYADAVDADLVVMGTHGRSGISRLLLGSVTESVVRNCEREVLTVPADAPPVEAEYDNVLIATDGSEGSSSATDVGLEVARTFNATVHGVYVVDEGVTQTHLIDELLQQEGRNAIEGVENRAEEAGLEVTTAVLSGSPHDEIATYATEHDVDIIVVGSHGKGALERTLLGSVSERTIRSADRPVLVTRHPEGIV